MTYSELMSGDVVISWYMFESMPAGTYVLVWTAPGTCLWFCTRSGELLLDHRDPQITLAWGKLINR